MSSSFRIEPLKRVDGELARQLCLLVRQHVPHLPDLPADYFQKAIENQAVKIFVALDKNNKIIGTVTMVSYRKVDGVYKTYIEDLIVDSQNRRQGIGRALVNKVIETARNNKSDAVHLTSNRTRLAANSLYEKIGFQFYDTNYYKYENLKKA